MLGITRLSLQTWLEAKPQDEIVGRGVDCDRCPVAMLIRETTGLRNVFVTAAEIEAGLFRTKAIPDWLVSFMLGVDFTTDPDRLVRAGEALVVLRSIAAE